MQISQTWDIWDFTIDPKSAVAFDLTEHIVIIIERKMEGNYRWAETDLKKLPRKSLRSTTEYTLMFDIFAIIIFETEKGN